jgi:hypothetical protein
MGTLYDDDVVAWAEQQAALIRARQWSQLDIDNVAEEIEDVGKSDKRALRNHMVILLMHLLKWAYQPARRGRSWNSTIVTQRAAIEQALADSPSLEGLLDNPDWLATTYRTARRYAEKEAGLQNLPADLPWTSVELMNFDFLPPPAAAPAKSDKKKN